MSAGKTALKTAGIAVGVAAGVAGAGYAAQRALIRSLRHRPDPDAGRLDHLPAGTTRRLPSHDGGSIYTIAVGPGHGSLATGKGDEQPDATILFSHGVMIDSRVWIKQFQSLPRRGIECIAFDHRGHGQSLLSSSPGEGDWLENLALDMRTVLEGLDLHDVVVVGHSMGGVAVQSFATMFPEVARERVSGFVLLSSLAKTQISASQRLRGVVERVAGGLDFENIMSRPDLGVMFARLGFGREPLASHVELARRMLTECDPDIGREGINALIGLDLTPELGKIDRPTLIVSGTNDLLTPPVESRRLARLIPDAELVTFERAGHMIMLERAEEFDSLLVQFAREVGALAEEPDRASA